MTETSTFRFHLPVTLSNAVTAEIAAWQTDDKVARIWRRDASVWTNSGEEKWLGWLDSAEQNLRDIQKLQALREDAKGFSQILVFGMGGSSLGPEVLGRTLRVKLRTLDSTDPQQIRDTEKAHDPANTLYINASKSGGTLETRILGQYFLDRAKEKLGDKAGSHFIAVTDPGSQLEKTAQAENFRHIFLGEPSIGGRYSVLSPFGLVPAAAAGIAIEDILESAVKMAEACKKTGAENPGLQLGTIIGVAARLGRDKVTISTSPGIGLFGAWIEQIVAESTGKHGKGIIPLDGEKLDGPEVYGSDRIFVDVALAGDITRNPLLDALEAAGHSVIRLRLHDTSTLGAEFFRWCFATAVAGAVIGINPFDQPDVESAKVKTRALMENGGTAQSAAADKISPETLTSFLAGARPGDYVALLGFLTHNDRYAGLLERARLYIRNKTKCATSLGFGPRFLHSTGQLYKGGPDTGLFIILTGDTEPALAVPGESYTFNAVIKAQAEGDTEVLRERGRRILRLHLGTDVETGLKNFVDAVKAACTP